MFTKPKLPNTPEKISTNPGICMDGKTAFTNSRHSWEEHFNLISILAKSLKLRNYSVKATNNMVIEKGSGLIFTPSFVSMKPNDDESVQTVSTIQINHPELCPKGVFEYQHATGNNLLESFSKGFDLWAQTDLIPLLDALLQKPLECTTMEFTFPAQGENPERKRRAVLGPTMQFLNESIQQKKVPEEEHPFCPCCLLTKSIEAFMDFIRDDQFYCIRLFALRSEKNESSADCRVNGEDFENGVQALRKYADSWPEMGYEFRKQYVILQNSYS